MSMPLRILILAFDDVVGDRYRLRYGGRGQNTHC